MAGLTNKRTPPFVNEGDAGCHGESAQEAQPLLPNTSDYAKKTTPDQIIRDKSSGKYTFKSTLLLGLGQEKTDVENKKLMGSDQARTQYEMQTNILGSGQAQKNFKRRPMSTASYREVGPLSNDAFLGPGPSRIKKLNFKNQDGLKSWAFSQMGDFQWTT